MNEIQTVKIQGQGYLLNGDMSVPKADGNREYELIKEWLKTNEPEPEFTEEEIEKQRISSIKAKAQSLILEKYPLEKQSSAKLGLYGQEYLDNMKAYILNIITISNEAEANGTLLEDIVWN